MNENENSIHQNLCDAVKVIFMMSIFLVDCDLIGGLTNGLP